MPIGVISAFSQENNNQVIDWSAFQKFDESSLPYPTVLIGDGTPLWDNVKRDVCPGCKNQELKPYEYCLQCDRWGLDRLIEEHVPNTQIEVFREHAVKLVNINARLNKLLNKV